MVSEVTNRRKVALEFASGDRASTAFVHFYFDHMQDFEGGGDVFLGRSGMSIIAE